METLFSVEFSTLQITSPLMSNIKPSIHLCIYTVILCLLFLILLYLLIHSFPQFFNRLFFHSCLRVLIPALMYSFTPRFIHSCFRCVSPLIHSLFCCPSVHFPPHQSLGISSFIVHSFTRSQICSCTHCLVHAFIHYSLLH